MRDFFRLTLLFLCIAANVHSQGDSGSVEAVSSEEQQIGPFNPLDYILKRSTTTPAQVQVEPKQTPAAPPTQPSVLPSTMPPKGKTNTTQTKAMPPAQKTILINFNNVSIIEFLHFISKMTNRNFVFEEADLQFNVTIISEEPTTIENIMTALLQELRIHNLLLLEQGENFIIHRNPAVNSIARVVAEGGELNHDSEIVTQVMRLNTIEAGKVSDLLKPLMSSQGLVEVLQETNHLIITDLVSNVAQIVQLLKSLDAPNSGLIIGQYVAKNMIVTSLLELAQNIMLPISRAQTLIFVPHLTAKSIFVISNPYLVERTIAFLRYLDQNQGTTRIFNLEDLKYLPGEGDLKGGWELDENGNWIYKTKITDKTSPEGYWTQDANGNWIFHPGNGQGMPLEGPDGQWVQDANGNWYFQLNHGKSISPERLGRHPRAMAELPAGHIERTQFVIYKLHYRRGDQIQGALGRIGVSLMQTGASNRDLVSAIESIQWLDSSNSLIITGTGEALAKVQELIEEIDIPLHQVYIEMLILDTTLDDSLSYGVDWGTRFGGGNTAGGETIGNPHPLATATAIPPSLPDASSLFDATGLDGLTMGIIGRTLTHNGTHFATITALVKALHNRLETKVVMTPRILTEDNNPAEIFVGLNTSFPTQSVVNNLGTIVTQNYEFRDVGTRLRVTPLVGENGVITLTIIQETTSIVAAGNFLLPTTNPGPTTRKHNTTTRVHLPDNYFLILSGLLEDDNSRDRAQVPCLGVLPGIGAAFSRQTYNDTKRNLMLFIHPKIVDTDEEIQNITKHQQDVYRVKSRPVRSWKYEVDGALDFFNLEGLGPCACPETCDYLPGR